MSQTTRSMDEDEVVLTSDPDEEENYEAYFDRPNVKSRARLNSARAAFSSPHASTSRTIGSTCQTADPFSETSPPRKRIKLSSQSPVLNEGRHNTPCSLLSSSKPDDVAIDHHIDRDPLDTLSTNILMDSSLPEQARLSSLPPRAPLVRVTSAAETNTGTSPPSTYPLQTPEPQSDGPLFLMVEDVNPDDDPESQSTIHTTHSIPFPTPKSPVPNPHVNVPSHDFTPQQHPATLFTPSRSVGLPGSVHTPSSHRSPILLPSSCSSSSLTSTSSEMGDTPQLGPPAAEPPAAPVQDASEPNPASYHLRERKPINLMPFRIDKAQYKHQLRANPEAMVVVRSPTRRRRKSPGLPSSDAEQSDDKEASVSSGRSDGERRRVRKGKERARETTGSSPEVEPDIRHHSPLRVGSPQTAESRKKWYPAAYHGLSSSSEEGLDPILPKVKVPERTKVKRRRVKPFPMAAADFRHSPSQPVRKAVSSSRPPSPPTDAFMELDHDPVDFLPGSAYRIATVSPQGTPLRDPEDVEIPQHQLISSSSDGFRSSGAEVPPTSSPIIDLTRPSPSGSPEGNAVNLSDEDDSPQSSGSSTDPGLAILRRMYPPRAVEQMLLKATRRPTAPSKKRRQLEHDDGPLQPGQARVRRAAVPHLDREIRGDSESSDGEEGPRSSSARSHLSQDSAISISSDSMEDHSDVQEPINLYWNIGKTFLRYGEAEEKDQIDYMLSRTSIPGAKRKRGARRHQNGNARTTGAKTRIVTGGARRHGSTRQTLLPFVRQPAPSRSATPKEPVRRSSLVLDEGPLNIDEEGLEAAEPVYEHYVSEGEAGPSRVSKARKKARQTKGHHVFPSNGGYIVSGRTNGAAVTIDVEEEGVGPSRLAHPVPSHRYRKPRSGAGHIGHSRTTRLEDYWIPGPHNVKDVGSVPLSPGRRDHSPDPRLAPRQAVDFEVPLLPSGITFASSTYTAKGYLHELLSLSQNLEDPVRPVSLTAFDCDFSTFSPTSTFTENLGKVGDTLLPIIADSSSGSLPGTRQDWGRDFHCIAQHVSWFLAHSNPDDLALLDDTIINLLLRLDDILEEKWESNTSARPPDPLTLELQWFAVELSWRGRSSTKPPDLDRMAYQIVRTLWDYGLQEVVSSLIAEEAQVLDCSDTPQRVAEVWACLIHLSQPPHPPTNAPGHLIWSSLRKLIQNDGMRKLGANGLELSRWIWQGIFGLCALSQFSVHGIGTSAPKLVPSWEVVALALKYIPLAANPSTDEELPRRALRQRDRYIRLLVSRCMLLNSRWRWPLDKAAQMFTSLHTVFKSRQFANLTNEGGDFPSFLRKHNIELLLDHQRSDTAFTLFLKLVVRAAKESMPTVPAEATLPPMVKKFLSLAIPIGAVQVTKTSIPTPHQLSSLYNRFSAIAVAIYLDPGQWEKLLDRVRYHYLDFGNADRESRRACIRGAMHLTILLQHLKLPLVGTLAWMGDMANVLVDEYREVTTATAGPAASRLNDKNHIIRCIELLLRSIQYIVKIPLMRADEPANRYPDPSLLQGPWVTRVFSMETDLTSIPTTGLEARGLVQTFLEARAAVMPKAPRPPIAPLPSEDSQESQEDYWHFDEYMDDPDLLVGTGVQISEETKRSEKVLTEVMDVHINPAIYRLFCKVFNEYHGPENFDDLGLWVDCWVGCASVVVYNGRRDWSFYLNLGQQSWQGVFDSSLRRRVGLRFMYRLLQLDPMAYPVYQDQFLEVLLESFATPKVTREHEYTSLMFSIDGLRLLCLENLPCARPHPLADFKISRIEFWDQRVIWVDHIFSRISSSLEEDHRSDAKLTREIQMSITCVLSFLAAMQDNYERMPADSTERNEYSGFCRSISDALAHYPALRNHPRIRSSVRWPEMFP